MIIKEIIEVLESFAPLEYAEDFDNVGLLVGDPGKELSGVLIALDTLEAVVDEAISTDCNLIVSFHPIIFGGLKKLTGRNYVERVVIKAIQNNIAIYSMHTALDNHFDGVNARICEVLGLQNRQVLIPRKGSLKKLTTYVPLKDAEALRMSLFNAGAGHVGNYSHCSFSSSGTGSFKGESDSNPTLGERGKLHEEEEIQLHITYTRDLEQKVLKALFDSHPYEEVAYEVITLDNTYQRIGMGMVGELNSPMEEKEFLQFVKERMNCGGIRHSELLGKEVRKVAVLGGSGAFAIDAAKAAKADFLLTGDIKYHQFYQAEGKMVVADIGHYESEQFTKNLLAEYLTKKIPNFAVRLSEINTNPIKYF
ncbi:Nif3-like dinuclear metal center hexameric protein [Lentiprolixibacter aurantiacus]|uniref:GTP cyclohydrolase 1 type 2 homolog n=1 Tax=Lentiprolixibacter aurantiacus TaxID=2993939 RepID=A0AAE3SN64_9FLAO|nr:Nif3-like dinuclear metal center hexameric protein [Lentiprolixibacter aurantiacus]MCX2719264.1 Nif3-like dinuclear metal center hexameric protein [Lentiprolixibacter aurantiacus]